MPEHYDNAELQTMANSVGTNRAALEKHIAAIKLELTRWNRAELTMKAVAVIAMCAIAVCVYLFFTAAPDETWWRTFTGIGAESSPS